MKNKMSELFNKLSPKGKLIVAIGGTVLVVGTVVGVAMDAATPERKTREAAKPQVAAILTDDDPRALGLDSLATQVRQLSGQFTQIERKIGAREEQLKTDRTDEKVSALEAQLSILQQELARVEREGGKKPKGDGSASQDGAATLEAGTATPSMIPPRREHIVAPQATSSSSEVGNVFMNLPPPPPEDPKARTSEKKESPKIRTISGDEGEKKVEPPKEISITLPAGSILSGVLVTGMDALTGTKAQRDPFPSLLRIKDEAILPNRFRADFRECHLIAGGWGDLSSERAYMRAERMTCVRNDGTVLEAPLEAYATGEDGKVGIRGRLVSKQGQLLSRSLMAGFMQGVAEAFNVKQVPTINVNRGSEDGEVIAPVYEQAMDSNALQAAGFQGAGTALERIADFYLDMAEDIYPVIEVDAMREVNFIVNKGMTVKFNETTLKVADPK